MLHISLEILAAGVALVPLLAVAYGYRRTRSPRLLLATGGFAVLEAKYLTLVVLHLWVPVARWVEELVNFAGDLSAMVIFAVAFLYRSWWFPDRDLADTA